MNTRRTCFIVNSGAGKRMTFLRRRRLIKRVQKIFPTRTEIVFSCAEEGIGSVAQLAQEAQRAEFKRIVGCGGDGTIHYIANGLLLPDPNLVIGIIPMGTANDFARNLRMPHSIRNALDVLAQDRHIPIDLGLANATRFVNTASTGLDASINSKAVSMKPFFRKLGMPVLAYVPPILKAFFQQAEEFEVNLCVDKQNYYTGRVNLVAITNSPSYGTGFKLNPWAKLDDGLLDACCLREACHTLLPYYLIKTLRGTHVSLSPQFFFRQFKEMRITSPYELPLQLDGEDYGTTAEITVSVFPASLNVLLNPQILLCGDPLPALSFP